MHWVEEAAEEQEDELDDLRGLPRLRDLEYSEWVVLAVAGELHDEPSGSSLSHVVWSVRDTPCQMEMTGEDDKASDGYAETPRVFEMLVSLTVAGVGMEPSGWMW